MQVTTWTLEQTTRPATPPGPLPADVRVDRALRISPEYARFLYGLVGGPWRWVDHAAGSQVDGPSALANYRARGFVVLDERVTDEDVLVAPLGTWVSTGGPGAG